MPAFLDKIEELLLPEFKKSRESGKSVFILQEDVPGHTVKIIDHEKLDLLIYKFDPKNNKNGESHIMPLEKLYKRIPKAQVMSDYVIFAMNKDRQCDSVLVLIVNLKSSRPTHPDSLGQVFAGLLLSEFICKTVLRLLLPNEQIPEIKFFGITCQKSPSELRSTSGKVKSPEAVHIGNICKEGLNSTQVYVHKGKTLRIGLFSKGIKT